MSTQNIEVITQGEINVEVYTGISQQNLYVGGTQPVLSGPGIWIETGLGEDGLGIDIWYEDGN